MSINKSTRYALHAALELAIARGEAVTTAQISARYEMPENVVSKVLQQLVRVGIAHSVRGVGGGYRLARPANEVTVQEIIDLFEPRSDPEACMLREEFGGECPVTEPTCRLRNLFREVQETVRTTLASVSLETLAS